MVIHLVIINVAVFLLMGIFYLGAFLSGGALLSIHTLLYDILALHSSPDKLLSRPWGFLTYMFTHLGVLHILFNMLIFFFFGNMFRSDLGNRRVLPLYLMSGFLGGLLYVIVYNLLPGYSTIDGTMVGASAAVMCFLVASATLMPNVEVMLFFFIAIRLKWLALGVVLIDVFSLPNGNLGGIIAHLGGAAFGFAYIRLLQNGTDLCTPLINLGDRIIGLFNRSKRPARKFKPKKSPLRIVRNQEAPHAARLDELLDKINEKGYDSLSADEKQWLKKYSDEK